MTHAASLTFGTTNISLATPSTTLVIASGSTADAFTINATSVVVSLSATGGSLFILTSSDYKLSIATTSGRAVAAALDCAGSQGLAGTASVRLEQTAGSATYTIVPTRAPCVVPLVTTGGIIIYPIVIHAPSYASTTLGNTLVIPVNATDPNGYPVSLSVALPPGATFSTTTDDLIWRPHSVGTTNATIVASDSVTQATSTIQLKAFVPMGSGDPSASSTGEGRTSIAASSIPSVERLKAEIATLEQEVQQLLAQLKSRGASASRSPSYAFTRNLTLGSRGHDVHALQVFLVQEETGPAARRLKSNGTTHYFGPLTRAALAEYQKSVGIKPAVGYFGPITRKYLEGHG